MFSLRRHFAPYDKIIKINIKTVKVIVVKNNNDNNKCEKWTVIIE